MDIGELSRNSKLVKVGAAIAAADNTDSDSTTVDMQGWNGVIFFSAITDSTATGKAAMTIEQSDDDGVADAYSALSGAKAELTCAVNDDLNTKSLAVSVHEPRKRYVHATRTTTVAAGAFGECWALLYGAGVVPVVDSTLVTWARAQSPAEA